MTNVEFALRQALLLSQATLMKHQAMLQCPDVVEALRQAKAALACQVVAVPVFFASGRYVRGPSRPQGTGEKAMVFQLPCDRTARMTADNLSALFAAHCRQDKD